MFTLSLLRISTGHYPLKLDRLKKIMEVAFPHSDSECELEIFPFLFTLNLKQTFSMNPSELIAPFCFYVLQLVGL